jgi:hypothetical protein
MCFLEHFVVLNFTCYLIFISCIVKIKPNTNVKQFFLYCKQNTNQPQTVVTKLTYQLLPQSIYSYLTMSDRNKKYLSKSLIFLIFLFFFWIELRQWHYHLEMDDELENGHKKHINCYMND